MSKNMLGRNAMGKGEIQYESLSRFFSLADIQSATNNFDDQMVIGIGGFGKVYKGFIDNGSTTVAIKRLNPESNQGAVSFGLRKWVSKILDFGLSKGTTSFSKTHITTAVKGTFGYLDPDNFRTQRLTKKSDVYAFVVVLLEVLCGRPSMDTRLEVDQISMIFWAQHCIETGRLPQIIDTSLRGQTLPNALKCFVEVAYKCLHDRPQERPTMAEVVAGLEFALASQHGALINDDRGPHPRTKKKLDSNPPYNNYFMSNAGSWLLCIGLRRPLLLQWISSWLLFIPMSNGGMLTTSVDPNRARHHTSTSTNGNNSGNQSYTSN
ncbi:unnamed protein product [Camellia sinensis]